MRKEILQELQDSFKSIALFKDETKELRERFIGYEKGVNEMLIRAKEKEKLYATFLKEIKKNKKEEAPEKPVKKGKAKVIKMTIAESTKGKTADDTTPETNDPSKIVSMQNGRYTSEQAIDFLKTFMENGALYKDYVKKQVIEIREYLDKFDEDKNDMGSNLNMFFTTQDLMNKINDKMLNDPKGIEMFRNSIVAFEEFIRLVRVCFDEELNHIFHSDAVLKAYADLNASLWQMMDSVYTVMNGVSANAFDIAVNEGYWEDEFLDVISQCIVTRDYLFEFGLKTQEYFNLSEAFRMIFYKQKLAHLKIANLLSELMVDWKKMLP